MSEEGAAPGAAPFSLTSYESLVLSHGGSESAISYQLSAISYQLSAISYQLSATGSRAGPAVAGTDSLDGRHPPRGDTDCADETDGAERRSRGTVVLAMTKEMRGTASGDGGVPGGGSPRPSAR